MLSIIGIELKSPVSLRILIFKLETVSVQFKMVNDENRSKKRIKKKTYFQTEIEL